MFKDILTKGKLVSLYVKYQLDVKSQFLYVDNSKMNNYKHEVFELFIQLYLIFKKYLIIWSHNKKIIKYLKIRKEIKLNPLKLKIRKKEGKL